MDPITFLTDLDAGNLNAKFAEAIKQAASGARLTRRPGQVKLTFEFVPIGDGNAVAVSHTLAYVQPTRRGKVTEEDKTQTQMYINDDGSVTVFPAAQLSMFERVEKTTEEDPLNAK